ncbi:hypothetical protein AB0O64_33400 [Streptomyces sp. NPDC088341]|uniref:hypothetical protein n=1 Tax=Streptomyces sp. NPDC088341 TaxID=3154870 RepID=UPI003418CCBF
MSNGGEGRERSEAVTDADHPERAHHPERADQAGRAEPLDVWAGRIAAAVAPDEISFAGLTARVYAGGGRGRRGLLRSAPPAPGGAGGELVTLLPALWHALAVSYDVLVAAMGSPVVSNAVSGTALLLALEERRTSGARDRAAGRTGQGAGAPSGSGAGTDSVAGSGEGAGAGDGAGPVAGAADSRPPESATPVAPVVPVVPVPVSPSSPGPQAGTAIGGVGAADLAVLVGAAAQVSRSLQDGGTPRHQADRAAAEAVAALYEGRDAGARAFLGLLAGHRPTGAPAPRPTGTAVSAVRRLRRRLATRLSGRGPGLPTSGG